MNKLILALLFSLPAFGAVTAATIWEFRSAGTATSGGGFDSTISGAGTDMSIFDNINATSCTSCQSATVNISKTDAVTNNTTTVTSATANFSSAIVGNTVYLAGTGTTTGWYQVVTFTNSTTIVVDRATGSTGGTGVTINIGGAIGSLTALEIAQGIVAGNTAYVKAGGWPGTTAALTFSNAGTLTAPISFYGYTTTRGDNGDVTITRSSGNTYTMMAISGAHRRFYDFVIDGGDAGTTIKGIATSASSTHLVRCQANNTTSNGIELSSSSSMVRLRNCVVTSGAGGIVVVGGGTAGFGTIFYGVVSYANSVSGYTLSGTPTTGPMIILQHCISANNTGATSDGYRIDNAMPVVLDHCTAFGNGANGLQIIGNFGFGFAVTNSVFVSNTGRGIKSDTNVFGISAFIDFNAFFGNSAAREGFTAGTNDVTLSADPFVAGASMDFALNATGTTELRGLGFPRALTVGGTGYETIGTLEPQVTGGGGQKGYVWMAKSGKRYIVDAEMYEALRPEMALGSIEWPLSMWQTLGSLALIAGMIVLKVSR